MHIYMCVTRKNGYSHATKFTRNTVIKIYSESANATRHGIEANVFSKHLRSH